MALISGALPIFLQIVSWFLGKSAASDQVKQKFLDLVAQYESDSGNTVRLADSERAQLESLKAVLDGREAPPS